MGAMTRSAWAMAMVSMLGGATLVGCGSEDDPLPPPVVPVVPGDPDAFTVTQLVEGGQTSTTRLDLLLVVDNSRFMADKQALLAQVVPDLVGEVGNPPCVLGDGTLAPSQPSSPLDDCPEASVRIAEPLTDIHIGVITSSLGGHGADTCVPGMNGADASVDDAGRLIDRQQVGGSPGQVPTYQGLGFLAWDPAQVKDPPGDPDAANVIGRLSSLVTGAGAVGCGFEATLESWYRFLVDPNPYEAISIEGQDAVLLGTDQVILSQRQAFLRPDSTVGIIVLSDENDCSIRDGGRFYFAAQSGSGQFRLPPPRAACATNPNDPCCVSCGDTLPSGCADQGECASPTLPTPDDALNLRCFDQKRRFGIDFLYPIERYVDGLTETEISDRDGNVVTNPLLVNGSTVRSPARVFVTGIVGVPWQDIARVDGNGAPSLLAGLDPNGQPVGGYQSADELTQNGRWAMILGEPETYVPPTDPLMIESVDPRSGTSPTTGAPLVAPNTNGQVGPIANGAEYTVGPGRDNLQYACIYPGASPVDCTSPGEACDCPDDCASPGPLTDNPLCVGSGESYRCTQYSQRAYPGRRHLQLLRDLGPQGVVASICAAQRDNPNLSDFGYRPAVDAFASAIQAPPPPSGCLPEPVAAACRLFEPGPTCGAGRTPVPQDDPVLASLRTQSATLDFCEVPAFVGDANAACRNDAAASGSGWCFASVANGDAVASACPTTSAGLLRVLGGAPQPVRYIACPATE